SSGPSGGRLCRCWQQLRHADQVVGRGGEVGPETVTLHTTIARLPPTSDGLEPAEDFLDPLAMPLADRVARMPRPAGVEVRAAVAGDVLRQMWRHAGGPQPGDEGRAVIRLVTPERAHVQPPGLRPPHQPH